MAEGTPGGNLNKKDGLALSVSLWERWHGVSRDGEGKDAKKAPTVLNAAGAF